MLTLSQRLSQRFNVIAPSMTVTLNGLVRQLQSEGKEVLNFIPGEPDFDTPQHIIEAGIQAIKEGQTRYTNVAGMLELRQAAITWLRKTYNLDYQVEDLLIGSGAKSLVVFALMAILDPGDEVLILSPYWTSYPAQVQLAGGVPVIVPTLFEESFIPDPRVILSKITKKTKAIIINSPNNPSGLVYSLTTLELIGEIARAYDLFVISDEIYSPLVFNNIQHIPFAIANPDLKNQTILIHGVSKGWAMTGWRIGLAAASPEIITLMKTAQGQVNSAPATMCQVGAAAAFTGPQDCLEEMRQAFQKRAELASSLFNQVGEVRCVPPQGGMYAYPDVTFYANRIGGTEVFCQELLRNYGVALVPGEAFGTPGFVRMCIASEPAKIIKGVELIARFITEEC